MRKYTLYILFLNLLGVNVQAQYYSSYCSGDSAARKGNNKLAIQLYKQKMNSKDVASKKFYPIYYYSIASCFALLGEVDSAYYNLNIFLVNNTKLGSASDILEDEDLNILHKDKRWEDVESKIKNLFFSNLVASDKELAYRFFRMLSTDQKYRNMVSSYEESFGRKSVQVDSLWKIQTRIDSINMIVLEETINKYGWPGISLIGTLGNKAAFLILQHADLLHQKKYFSLLKESANKGQSEMSSVAFLEDRIRVSEGKKQLYGSQLETNKKTGKMELSAIEDEIHVDERRAKMGLDPIKDYVKDWGINYIPPQERPVNK